MTIRFELTNDDAEAWRLELLRQVASGYTHAGIATALEAIAASEAWGQLTSDEATLLRELLDDYERSQAPN